MWSVIVHGGAGAIDDRQSEPHQAGCRRAVEAAASVLSRGGSALDAVVAAVVVLEDDPVFNAGTGGALDEDGEVSSDAAVMRASDLGYGAIGAVSGVKNPITLARAVLEDGRHSLLAGPGAVRFARKKGVVLCDPHALITDPSRAKWWHATAERASDTVGAVARDAGGEIVAGTSTGGLLGKYSGRVGDSPIAGAGTYARSDWGGISATGHGETMMKTVLCYEALVRLADRGAELPEVVLRRVLDAATARIGGKGGLIAVLPDGAPVWARNTAHMGVAWQSAGGPLASAF